MIHIITGPPCAGKSTYVRENAKSGDLRIDYDLIAQALGAENSHAAEGLVKQAAFDLLGDASHQELLGSMYRYYSYYHEAYTAALGGLVGAYAIEKDGQWIPTYGLKAFSPIASGYGYSHCDDFGVGRSFGFQRNQTNFNFLKLFRLFLFTGKFYPILKNL